MAKKKEQPSDYSIKTLKGYPSPQMEYFILGSMSTAYDLGTSTFLESLNHFNCDWE